MVHYSAASRHIIDHTGTSFTSAQGGCHGVSSGAKCSGPKKGEKLRAAAQQHPGRVLDCTVLPSAGCRTQCSDTAHVDPSYKTFRMPCLSAGGKHPWVQADAWQCHSRSNMNHCTQSEGEHGTSAYNSVSSVRW